MQKALLDRLHQLDWTVYQLALEYGRLQNPGEELSPAQLAARYQATVAQALQNPEKSQFKTIQNLLRAMNGSMRIQFTDFQNIELS